MRNAHPTQQKVLFFRDREQHVAPERFIKTVEHSSIHMHASMYACMHVCKLAIKNNMSLLSASSKQPNTPLYTCMHACMYVNWR